MEMDGQNISTSTFASSAALSPFYQNLRTAGFVPLLVVVTGIRTLIALVSILLNLDLVWLTWRTRSLHGTCNWLIALESLSLAFYQAGITAIFGVVLSARNLIRLETCFWIQVLPVFGKFFSMGMMCAIGLDRVKCIVLPMWPRESSKRWYILALTLLCSLCPLYILYVSFIVMLREPDIPVMCASSEISQKEANMPNYVIGLVLNLLSPAIYGLLCIILFIKRKQISSLDKNHSIYKSLLVIVIIELLGWGTNSAFAFFFGAFFSNQLMTDYQKWAVNAVFSYVICLATAANAPALYFCSFEYRMAFQKHFGWIKGLRHKMGQRSNGTQLQITVVNSVQPASMMRSF